MLIFQYFAYLCYNPCPWILPCIYKYKNSFHRNKCHRFCMGWRRTCRLLMEKVSKRSKILFIYEYMEHWFLQQFWIFIIFLRCLCLCLQVVQYFPSYPSEHWQMKPFDVSIHTPPFKQGPTSNVPKNIIICFASMNNNY